MQNNYRLYFSKTRNENHYNNTHFFYLLGPLGDISVWLRNLLISPGLDPVLSHSEKSCMALYYRQFSTNIKIKYKKNKIKLIPVSSNGSYMIILSDNTRLSFTLIN